MPDKFETWGKAEGENDNRAFRTRTDTLTSSIYYAEEVVVTGGTTSLPVPVDLIRIDVEVPIKALDVWQASQIAVTTVSPAFLAADPLPTRKSISVKADPANTATIYVGNSSFVTTTNGWPLAAGDSLDLEGSGGINIFAIALSGTQNIAWAEIGSST